MLKSTDEAQLVAELKEDFPSLYDCRIMMDRATGVSRGYGFVSFQDRADAERLLKETRRIQGKAVRLNWAFDGYGHG